MLAKFTWKRGTQLVVILLSAFTLKLYYSTASVNDLRWILSPTATLVQLVTGSRFYFESYAGYINGERSFVIAASCAGVNFLITAFLLLSLRELWSERPSWKYLPIAASVAYVATLIANTVRISTAVQMHRTPQGIGGLSGNQLHRFEGIFVYFGFLMLLCLLTESVWWTTHSGAGSPVTTSEKKFKSFRRLDLLRRVSFPLLIYYATALGIPLGNAILNRGSTVSDFGEHAIFVLLTPLTLLLPVAAFRFHQDLRRRRRWGLNDR